MTDAACWRAVEGDCVDVLAGVADCSVDSVVTDPPYGLSGPPDPVMLLEAWLAQGSYRREGGRGYMGRGWDGGVPGPAVWREVFRVLRPGGHAVVFAGQTTVDLTGMALRLAGFEPRSMVAWLYGQGQPKGVDVGKRIDAEAGAVREVVSRVTTRSGGMKSRNRLNAEHGYRDDGYDRDNTFEVTVPATDDAKRWDGWNTEMRPCVEPVLLVRRPLSERTVAANVVRHAVGALNARGCEIPYVDAADRAAARPAGRPTSSSSGHLMTPDVGQKDGRVGFAARETGGRWPPNVAVDACVAADLDRGHDPYGPSRYFFCPKPSRAEKLLGTSGGRVHPTVKPVELMRWLCRLVTPPGGLVADPFAGSGTTGVAAVADGFRFLGVDDDAEGTFGVMQERLRHVERLVAFGWRPGPWRDVVEADCGTAGAAQGSLL